MAIYPKKLKQKERLQPGARGEFFKANFPGYRNKAKTNRINRSR